MSFEVELNGKYQEARQRLINGYGKGVVDTPVSCPSASNKYSDDKHLATRKELEAHIKALTNRIEALEQQLLPKPMPTAQCERIIQFVCKTESVKKADLFCDRRSAMLTKIRHIGFYLCTRCTSLSLPIIAVAWKRDHTSILHGRDRITAWRERDPALHMLLEWYEREIRRELSTLVTD